MPYDNVVEADVVANHQPEPNWKVRCFVPGCETVGRWWTDDDKCYCNFHYNEKFRFGHLRATQVRPGPTEFKEQ